MKSKVLSIFISFILVSSIVGYMFSGSGDESIKYKGYKFVNDRGNWIGNVNGQRIFISERPDLLENISGPDLELNYLNSMNKIYLSMNPEDKLDSSLYLFSLNILSKLKPVITRSCIDDSEECYNTPLKSCEDATANTFVIIIERGEEDILYNNNCLEINGDTGNILKYLDKLTLNLLI